MGLQDSAETPKSSVQVNTVSDALDIIERDGNQRQHFEIDPKNNPLTAQDLRSLVQQKWEFSIHENDGRLILAVGEKSHPQSDEELGFKRESQLYLHTHPEESENIFLSMSDVFKTTALGADAQLILVTKKGLIVYRRPQFDPIRNRPTSESPREIMYEWGRREGVNFYSRDTEGEKSFFDLDESEQMDIARRFCEDTFMIVEEVEWEDEKATEKIIAAINLKERVSDNSAPAIPSVLDGMEFNIDELALSASQKGKLDAVIDHFDAVLLRKGALFRKGDMRRQWVDFAYELIEEVREEGVDERVEEILRQLSEKGKNITVD